jgi:predicted RNase H-like HicB family nuclease
MKYRVKLEKTDEGYAVWCPGLPGCWSQGKTEEEALVSIKDAIETYLVTYETGGPRYQNTGAFNVRR